MYKQHINHDSAVSIKTCESEKCEERAKFKFADHEGPNSWVLCVRHLEAVIKAYNKFNLMYRIYPE